MANLSRYLIRRAITLVPTVLGVIVITFAIGYIIPADLARAWAGGEKADPVYAEILARKYHLRDPPHIQFYFLLKGILTNTLTPPTRDTPVFTDLFARFHITFQLALLTVFFAVVIGIPLGIIAALKKDTAIDNTVRSWALAGTSMPSFWFAYIMMYIFFTRLRWTYLAGDPLPSKLITGFPLLDALLLGEFNTFYIILKRYWLPAMVLGILYAGAYARYLRNTLLDVLQSEFILFLKSKGVPRWWVWKHALKNSMIPMVTIIGFSFSGLLGGAVITETIFALPGIGYYVLQALYNLDFPIIIGATLLFAIIIVLTSLIVDIIYSIIDPRIRY